MLENIKGVIIKTRPYGETHKIVTIFSGKIGKFNGVARGANRPRSRMAAVTQPFIYGNFLVYLGRGLSTVQQGEILHAFRNIRDDIVKTAYIAYMMELTDRLIEEKKPQLYLYEQFLKTLQWINHSKEHDSYLEIPTLMYELKIYAHAGFAPVVENCVTCQRSDINYRGFSIEQGGLLCESCFENDRRATQLTPNVAKLFYIFKHMSIERLGNISIQEKNIRLMRKIIDAYYDTYGSYYIKSRNFLKQLDHLK